MRHTNPGEAVLVRSVEATVTHDITIASHTHEWDQLTFASAGAMQLETSDGSWMVPPHGAVWVPCGIEHAERLYAGVTSRTLYFQRSLTAGLPRACRSVNVSALLHELIVRVSGMGALDRSVPRQSRLAGILLDELESLEETALQLPTPRDPRALRFARLIDDAPDTRASVVELARIAGASRRTIERLFIAQTGLSAGEWRQRRRLLHALRMLATEHSVTDVALSSGYSSTSAFIAAFRKSFGVTPRRYRQT